MVCHLGCVAEEEKELRRYLASLFAVPPPGGSRELRCSTEPTLSIIELDQVIQNSNLVHLFRTLWLGKSMNTITICTCPLTFVCTVT